MAQSATANAGSSRFFYRVAYVPALVLVLFAVVDVSITLPELLRESVLSLVFLGTLASAVVAAIANAYLGGSLLASVANTFSILVGFFGIGFVNEATGNVEPTVHGGGLLDYVLVVPYLLALGALGAIAAALVAFAVGRVLRRLVSPSSVGLDRWPGNRTGAPERFRVSSLVVGDPETSGRFYRITYWLAATFVLVGFWMVQWNFPFGSVSLLGRSVPELLLWGFVLLAFLVSVANSFSGGGLAVSIAALFSLVVGLFGVGLFTAMAGPVPASVAFYDSLGASILVTWGGTVYASFLGVIGYALGAGMRDVVRSS